MVKNLILAGASVSAINRCLFISITCCYFCLYCFCVFSFFGFQFLTGFFFGVAVSHERTPMDEAVSRGKMDVIDAIGAAVAQVELSGTRVS